MPRITIKSPKSTTLIVGERLRLATIKPQAARLDVVIAKLDVDYYRHLDSLRGVVRKLRKRKK